MLPLLVLLGTIAGAWYLLIVRPQRHQQSHHGRLVERLQVGDHVLTIGGIYGRVVGLDTGSVVLELAPGLTSRIATDGIARIVQGSEAPPAPSAPRVMEDHMHQNDPHQQHQQHQQPYAHPQQPVSAPGTTTFRAQVLSVPQKHAQVPQQAPQQAPQYAQPWQQAPVAAPQPTYLPPMPSLTAPQMAQPAHAQPMQYAQPVPMQYAQQAPMQYAQPMPVQQYAQPMPAQQYAQPMPAQYAQPAPVQYAAPAPMQYAPEPVQHAPEPVAPVAPMPPVAPPEPSSLQIHQPFAPPTFAPVQPPMLFATAPLLPASSHAAPAPATHAHGAAPYAEPVAAPEGRRASRAPKGMGSTLRLDDPSLRDPLARAREERADLAREYERHTAPLVDTTEQFAAVAPQHLGHPVAPGLVHADPQQVVLEQHYPGPARPPQVDAAGMPRPAIQVPTGPVEPAFQSTAFQRATPYAPQHQQAPEPALHA
ncbi:MAG: preprotein translocase, YajC subunit [Thermoleophilia bacterium]|nr:preprotein translocase, YajC subunit [Thermoleophilia bacterium]